jgi:hypothetical protein
VERSTETPVAVKFSESKAIVVTTSII